MLDIRYITTYIHTLLGLFSLLLGVQLHRQYVRTTFASNYDTVNLEIFGVNIFVGLENYEILNRGKISTANY